MGPLDDGLAAPMSAYQCSPGDAVGHASEFRTVLIGMEQGRSIHDRHPTIPPHHWHTQGNGSSGSLPIAVPRLHVRSLPCCSTHSYSRRRVHRAARQRSRLHSCCTLISWHPTAREHAVIGRGVRKHQRAFGTRRRAAISHAPLVTSRISAL